jgi:non-homologous end joining protein Ku
MAIFNTCCQLESELKSLFFVGRHLGRPAASVLHHKVQRPTCRERASATSENGGFGCMLLRHPYEVRDQAEYLEDIELVKITKDMLDLANHIVERKSSHFDPTKFEDHYEAVARAALEKAKGSSYRCRKETYSEQCSRAHVSIEGEHR